MPGPIVLERPVETPRSLRIPRLTLQRIALVNAKSTPAQAIPAAPAPCSQGWDDGQGGALYMRDGNLTVIDAIFTNNHAAPLGPDTGGGAIYLLGSKNGALIVGSTFTNNAASNAGAVGGLFAQLSIYNSLLRGTAPRATAPTATTRADARSSTMVKTRSGRAAMAARSTAMATPSTSPCAATRSWITVPAVALSAVASFSPATTWRGSSPSRTPR
jgi:hypothetical protein